MTPSENEGPMFKRARYRRSYWQGASLHEADDLIIDEDGTILNDEGYRQQTEAFDDYNDFDEEDDLDDDAPPDSEAPFWTRRRVLLLILALIILLSMLAADLEGILFPPPTLPPPIPLNPGPLI